MKKILIIAFILIFLSLTYSQNNNDQVDLRKLFREKVNEIKNKNFQNYQSKKEILNNLPSTAKVVKKSASVQNSPVFDRKKIVAKNVRKVTKATNSTLLKGFILFEASLLAAIIVVYRRKKMGYKKALRKELKQNIGLLREEKLLGNSGKELESLRKSLVSKKLSLKNGSQGITSIAKKLSIAKGEVHLAIKLNLIAGE